MIVDSHFHAWPADASFAADRAYLPVHARDIRDGLDIQTRHGVTHGVLIQPSFLGTDNSYLLACLADNPERLRGTVVVDPDTSLEELEAMGRLGAVGLRLNLHSSKTMPNYTSAAYDRLFDWAAAQNWHVEVLAQGAIWADVFLRLERWDVDIVVDHFGMPSRSADPEEIGFEAILAAGSRGRAWVKFSASYRQDVPDLRAHAARLLAAFGPDRVVWASDYPWTKHEEGRSYQAVLDELSVWVPDAALRSAVLGANAARLFRFPAFEPETASVTE